MCLNIRMFSLPRIAHKDLYILKEPRCTRKYNESAKLMKDRYEFIFTMDDTMFESQSICFRYLANKLYKKKLGKIIGSFFTNALEEEVFHSYGFHKNLSVKQLFEISNYTIPRGYGLFLIPKGTLYYEDIIIDDIGTFAIRYIGPLTAENIHLLTLPKT